MTVSVLNNATAPDAFSDSATLFSPDAGAFVVTVANAAVYVDVGHGKSGLNWPTVSTFLVPGVHTLAGGDALRVRNAVAGVVAQVSARAAPGKALEGGAYASLSGLQVDAAGNVSYNFDGHIHATGIDLDAGTTGTPPNDRKIRWVRTTDGWVAVEEFGYSTSDNDAKGSLQAWPKNGGYGQLLVDARSGAGTSRVSATAASSGATASVDIIRDDGSSSFALKAAGFSAGDIKWAIFNTDPANWVECDNRTLGVGTTGTLRQLLINAGYPFGSVGADPRVPDLRERFVLGKSGTIPYSAVGNTGGEKTHQLTVAEMPSHDHGGSTGNASAPIGVGGVGIGNYAANSNARGGTINSDNHAHSIGGQGGDGAHNNMPPYIVLYALIKL